MAHQNGFDPVKIKALCHRDTPAADLHRFNDLLFKLSLHRAAERGEADERRATLNAIRQFIIDKRWGYDHIDYFFSQGGGSYLVTPEEFYRYLINEYYRTAEILHANT